MLYSTSLRADSGQVSVSKLPTILSDQTRAVSFGSTEARFCHFRAQNAFNIDSNVESWAEALSVGESKSSKHTAFLGF